MSIEKNEKQKLRRWEINKTNNLKFGTIIFDHGVEFMPVFCTGSAVNLSEINLFLLNKINCECAW